MHTTDPLTVGEIARRSGFAESAVRYYEGLGLLTATRRPAGSAVLSAARSAAGVHPRRTQRRARLDEVAEALASLPAGRTPTRADWTRLSRDWRLRLDDQIAALTALRDGLDWCLCAPLQRCAISNPGVAAGSAGPARPTRPAGLAAATRLAAPIPVSQHPQAGERAAFPRVMTRLSVPRPCMTSCDGIGTAHAMDERDDPRETNEER